MIRKGARGLRCVRYLPAFEKKDLLTSSGTSNEMHTLRPVFCMGIHNLKSEIQMDVLPGRKLEDLRTYAQQHPAFLLLTPEAVIMDLAQAYHTWISECFPCALRIADRFHVYGYVIDCVQNVRRTVEQTLSPGAKTYLKAHHRLLTLSFHSSTQDSMVCKLQAL